MHTDRLLLHACLLPCYIPEAAEATTLIDYTAGCTNATSKLLFVLHECHCSSQLQCNGHINMLMSAV